MLKVYSYKGCDGCRKALKWLDAKGIDYENVAIRETPPANRELETMLN
ncbi:MAG TPA: ArsC family transcriptional regulator, partial [Opitutae bacterium]|nr:ArsC family transcriptional regulator [Opitutae bacterium]